MVAPTETPITAFETQAPSGDIADSMPTMTPTQDIPDAPSTSPTTEPSLTQTPSIFNFSPSAAPLEPCISTDGTFGVVSGTAETDVTVSYMYEMETVPGVKKEMIDSVILPQLEKAIVDSVLQDIFPGGCVGTGVGKRHLRLQRRLTVTGITMNPSDFINEECE
jgi:hypothetical protein